MGALEDDAGVAAFDRPPFFLGVEGPASASVALFDPRVLGAMVSESLELHTTMVSGFGFEITRATLGQVEVRECGQGPLPCGISGGCMLGTSCSWMVCRRGEMDYVRVGEYSQGPLLCVISGGCIPGISCG